MEKDGLEKVKPFLNMGMFDIYFQISGVVDILNLKISVRLHLGMICDHLTIRDPIRSSHENRGGIEYVEAHC